MINLKNDKGVTLIILTITIIVLLIITGITINNSKSQLMIKKVNNLYSDIDSISTKVSDYYLKNNSLPVFDNNIYLNSSSELGTLIEKIGGDKSVINANDDGPYYVLNLSKLENLTLNFGSEYKKWNDTSISNMYQDLYIINGVTHQIYYPKGIAYGKNVYFTKNSEQAVVERIKTATVSDEFKILSIEGKKNKIENSDKVIVSADVELSIGSNYKKDTLKYAWKVYDDDDDESLEYTPFMTDDLNNTSLMSKTINNSRKYVLYIKVIDVDGDVHLIKQEVILMEPLILAMVDDLGTSSTIYLYGNSNEITSGNITITMPDGTTSQITALEDNSSISDTANYKTYDVTKNGTYTFTAIDGEYTTETKVKVNNIEKFELVDNLGLAYYNSDNKAYKYKGAAIPKGFYVDTNSEVETGLVVTDAIDEEGYSIGNEWVWVPVNSTVENDDLYVEDSGTFAGAETISYTKYGKLFGFSKAKERDEYGSINLGKPSARSGGYREPSCLIDANEGEGKNYIYVNKRGTTDKFESVSDLATQYTDDFNNMIECVSNYNGFFIGRYELSGTEEEGKMKKGEVLSKKSWYIMYNSCLTFDKENVTSSMVYGTLWDAAMQWLAKSDISVGNTENSTCGYGNYKNEEISVKNENTTIIVKNAGESTKLFTGQTSFTKRNNIFDLAGNSNEYSQEAISWNCRAIRGGSFLSEDVSKTYASSRNGKFAVYGVGTDTSTRPVFYIN